MSGRFPDCLETFHIVYKLSRLSGQSSDCLYLFKIARDSKTCGCATAQNFSDFAQNLEICMRKLIFFFILTWFLQFFLHFSHILSGKLQDCLSFLFCLENFQIIWKLSRLTGNFQDFLKISLLSVNVPDCLKSFRVYTKFPGCLYTFQIVW